MREIAIDRALHGAPIETDHEAARHLKAVATNLLHAGAFDGIEELAASGHGVVRRHRRPVESAPSDENSGLLAR